MCIAAGCLYLKDRITLTRQKTPRLRKKFDSNQLKSRDRIPSVLFLAMKSGPISFQKINHGKSFNRFLLLTSEMLLYIHASPLSDNFDRVQLEFVGFKKVVFVRFCPQQIFGRRNIQPFALIGSCPALFIEPGITISITKNQPVHLKFRISGGIFICLKNPCRTSILRGAVCTTCQVFFKYVIGVCIALPASCCCIIERTRTFLRQLRSVFSLMSALLHTYNDTPCQAAERLWIMTTPNFPRFFPNIYALRVN